MNQNELVLVKENVDVKLISCGFYFSVFYCSNGDLFMMGSNFDYPSKIKDYQGDKPNFVMNDKSIISICCSQRNILILKDNGDVFLDFDIKVASNISSIHCGLNIFLKI